MKILVLNTYDNGGGAANAAFRLVEALVAKGFDIRLGVKQKRTNADFVFELPKKKNYYQILYKNVLKILNKFFSKKTNQIHTSFDVVTSVDIDWINKSDFDIVHLHWLHDDMISIKDISRIKKKLVWTLHDSWVCCGAEHHPNVLENDNRWQVGYFKNNKPKSSKGFDGNKYIWNMKKKYWTTIDVKFIAPSNWEKNVLRTSKLFYNVNCCVIPNLINKNEFLPMDKDAIRKELGIPTNKLVLGFGAAYGVDNPRSIKGTFYLLQALKQLEEKEKYFLVIFGNSSEKLTSKLDIDYKEMGFSTDNHYLAKIYNCLDVFLNPSIIENLPTTCIEAISCCVPVVAFNVGGTEDVIKHRFNGYLATPYNPKDFTAGIIYCTKENKTMIRNCNSNLNNFIDNKLSIQKHINLYQSLL